MRFFLCAVFAGALLLAQRPAGTQVPNPNDPNRPRQAIPSPQQVRPSPVPQTPAAQLVPVAPAPTPATATSTTDSSSGPKPTVPAGLNLTNASLAEVIDILARDLKINYILDPKVKGSVTINTYGELRAVDIRNLLETILRMNSYTMVQVGNIYRIVPSGDSPRLPISPQMEQKDFSDSEAPVLNLIFLKYVSSAEIAKLLEPFMGEGYKMVSYDPANLLIVQDNSRNMKRTVELIGMFDSESLAGQRARAFPVTNARPSDVVRDLDTIFKAYSFSEKTGIKFIPIDRISTIIGVAGNPQIFKEVANWLEKLDVPVKLSAGAVDNHLYRLKYGRAEVVGNVVAQLYGTSIPTGLMGYGLPNYGGYHSGTLAGGGGGGGGFGMGGGGGFGGSGSYGSSAMGGVGSSLGGSLGGNTNAVFGNSGLASGVGTVTPANNGVSQTGGVNAPAPVGASPFGNATTTGQNDDQTGQYLTSRRNNNGPRIIPNPFDNTLLVQSTPEQWESILRLLEQLDVPPRQVLIDARIYEVALNGSLSLGVEALLQPKTTANKQLTGSTGTSTAAGSPIGAILNAGTLVGRSRELLATVNALETRSLAKSISAPQIIATDSIPASITVGDEIPTISGTSIGTGLGSSITSSIQTVGTGVNLNLIARINSSGVITLLIDQDISAPTGSSYGSIQSPTFSRRNVSTQITVDDGDTIAIGGIITENTTSGVSGVPFLDRIPYIGGVFGSKTYNKTRTELILFLTPHVIYDTNQMTDATEELKTRMRSLKKDIRNQ